MASALVIAGGDPERTMAAVSRLPARPDLVVGVDAGVEVAVEHGIAVDVAVGDFDSLSPALVDRLDDLAAHVVRHPPDKDATDLALALDECVERLPAGSSVLVAGVEGDRPDHAFAATLLVASPRYRSLSLSVLRSDGQVWVLHAGAGLDAGGIPVGATISVVPVHGAAEVSIGGVRWPLDHRRLDAGSTLGVSNEIAAAGATVACHAGVVVVIVPDR